MENLEPIPQKASNECVSVENTMTETVSIEKNTDVMSISENKVEVSLKSDENEKIEETQTQMCVSENEIMERDGSSNAAKKLSYLAGNAQSPEMTTFALKERHPKSLLIHYSEEYLDSVEPIQLSTLVPVNESNLDFTKDESFYLATEALIKLSLSSRIENIPQTIKANVTDLCKIDSDLKCDKSIQNGASALSLTVVPTVQSNPKKERKRPTYKPFYCDICSRVLSTPQGMARHKRACKNELNKKRRLKNMNEGKKKLKVQAKEDSDMSYGCDTLLMLSEVGLPDSSNGLNAYYPCDDDRESLISDPNLKIQKFDCSSGAKGEQIDCSHITEKESFDAILSRLKVILQEKMPKSTLIGTKPFNLQKIQHRAPFVSELTKLESNISTHQKNGLYCRSAHPTKYISMEKYLKLLSRAKVE